MIATQTENLDDILARDNACDDARTWAKRAGLKTPAEAWDACPDPDWMFWALDKIGYDDKRVLRLFACWSARQVWRLLDDERSRNAVEVAERFAIGEATDEELTAARDAAWDAAWDAARDAARDAAWDAWDAARAAAWAAAWAAWDAWDAARAAAWAAAWAAARQAQADQLRRLVGNPFIDFQV